jgi:ATP-binding protein involved in chromosome partitioning
MSYFICPHCNEQTNIFSHGGGVALAKEMSVPFLGSIPIDLAIREGGDLGKPITAIQPEHPVSKAFEAVAKQVAAQISIQALSPAPSLV